MMKQIRKAIQTMMAAGIKHYGNGAASIAIMLILLLAPCLAGQDQVLEKVQVTNREVVVRVFDGGQPVSGLTEKDFLIFENGKERPVTSCRELHRAMFQPKPASEAVQETTAAPEPGRLFLFLLWWNEKSDTWPDAWKYFNFVIRFHHL